MANQVVAVHPLTHSILTIILICALAFGGYYLYTYAYQKGYERAIKDNPPEVYNGPATIYNNAPSPEPFWSFKFWFIHIHGAYPAYPEGRK